MIWPCLYSSATQYGFYLLIMSQHLLSLVTIAFSFLIDPSPLFQFLAKIEGKQGLVQCHIVIGDNGVLHDGLDHSSPTAQTQGQVLAGQTFVGSDQVAKHGISAFSIQDLSRLQVFLRHRGDVGNEVIGRSGGLSPEDC